MISTVCQLPRTQLNLLVQHYVSCSHRLEVRYGAVSYFCTPESVSVRSTKARNTVPQNGVCKSNGLPMESGGPQLPPPRGPFSLQWFILEHGQKGLLPSATSPPAVLEGRAHCRNQWVEPTAGTSPWFSGKYSQTLVCEHNSFRKHACHPEHLCIKASFPVRNDGNSDDSSHKPKIFI